MRIRLAVERWILEKWYSRCTCRKNNTIIYYLYYIFIIYYSSDSPSSLITESLSVTQSLSSLSSPSSSHRMSSSDPSKALLMQHFLKDLTIMLTGMAFHAADTHRATSEGAARKGRLKERCGLEPRTNFFSFNKSTKLARIRFGCGLDSRIYGTYDVRSNKEDSFYSVRTLLWFWYFTCTKGPLPILHPSFMLFIVRITSWHL